MKTTITLPSALRVFTTGRSSGVCACVLVLACSVLLRTSGYAQLYAYTTNSGDWNNAAIWNTPPVDGLQAFVTGNDTVTFQSGDSYTGAFNFGFWGSLIVGTSDGFVGTGNGGTGTLNVTGGTLTTGGWAVGAAAAGTINQSGGTFNAIGQQMLFGWGATATMNISGGTMNMTGAGIWRIGHTASSSINVTGSGVANFTGGMAVDAFSAINANGGTVNISNATIDIAAGSQLRATNGGSINLNGGNTFTGNGGFVVGGASAVNVNSGTNTYAGEVSLAANATITAGSGALLTLNPGTGAAVSLTSGRTLTIGGPGSVLVGGAITGTGNLILAGATSAGQNGTVTLSGSNSFSGFLQAGGGFGSTLRVGHDNALGAGTVFLGQNLLLTSDGAATRTIGNTVNLANIAYYGDATGTGDLIFTGSNVATGNQRIMDVRNSTTISGVVSGTGGLDKRGAGTLTLSGNNTYASGTTVNAGSLIINGNQSSATGVLNVAAGATLGGSGTIGGATTISGIHRPGNSAGVQTFASDLTYSGTPTVQWELTANTTTQGSPTPVFDQIVVDGDLDFAVPTALTLNFALPGSAVDWSDGLWANNITGTSGWLVYDVGGALSNLTNFSISVENWADGQGDLFNTVRAGSSFSLYNDNVSGDIYLNYAVPEPSTYALIMLAGAGLMAHRWRNRRRSGGGASGQ